MPNAPMTLDPAAMRFSEINRRAELARTPIQFAGALEGGLKAGRAVEDLQAEKAKREKAAHFEQILQAGLPAMQQAWGELSPEDRKRIPDPQLFTDTRDATVSWWSLAAEAHQRNQVATSLAAGDVDEAAGAAARMTKDPTALVNSAREQAAKDKTAKEKADKEAGLAQSFTAWRKAVSSMMDSADYELNDKILNRITDSFPNDLAGYEPAEKWRDNLVKKAAPPAPNPFAAANQDLKSQGQLFQQENALRDEFDKKTETFRTASTAYRKLHQALARNNPADAYSAIINYVRTLDPGSTVREAEERLARERAAGGPLGAFGQYLENLKEGKLTDPIRKNLLEAGRGLVNAEREGYVAHRSDYSDRVKGYQGRGFSIDEGAVLGKDLGAELDSLLSEDIFSKKPAGKPAAAPAAKPVKPKSDPLGLF